MSDDLIRREAAKWLFLKMCIEGGWSPHDVHFSTLDVVDNLDAVESAEPEQKWIPADNPPETDEYILLSFENYSVPMVGRYEDCNYYVGDETEPLCKQDIFVNAWMPLPEPWRGDSICK